MFDITALTPPETILVKMQGVTHLFDIKESLNLSIKCLEIVLIFWTQRLVLYMCSLFTFKQTAGQTEE